MHIVLAGKNDDGHAPYVKHNRTHVVIRSSDLRKWTDLDPEEKSVDQAEFRHRWAFGSAFHSELGVKCGRGGLEEGDGQKWRDFPGPSRCSLGR